MTWGLTQCHLHKPSEHQSTLSVWSLGSCEFPSFARKDHRPVCIERANILDQRNIHPGTTAPDPEVTVSCGLPSRWGGGRIMALPCVCIGPHKLRRTDLSTSFLKISPCLPQNCYVRKKKHQLKFSKS